MYTAHYNARTRARLSIAEFSFFQASRRNSRASNTTNSSCRATTSVDSESPDSIETASWDQSSSGASVFHAEHTPLYQSVRNISAPSTHRVPTQRYVNGNPSGNTSSSLQGLTKSNTVDKVDMLPWWSAPPLLAEEEDTAQKRQIGMARFSSTPRLSRTIR